MDWQRDALTLCLIVVAAIGGYFVLDAFIRIKQLSERDGFNRVALGQALMWAGAGGAILVAR